MIRAILSRKRSRRALARLVCLGFLLAPSLARAQLIYEPQFSNIVTVDPQTGNTVTRGPALSAHLGVSATDILGHRIFYEATVGSGNVLAIFHTDNPSLTDQVPLSGPLAFMAFDPVTQLVFGARYDQVVSISPTTGSETPIVATSPTPYLSTGVLDSVNRKLYFFASGPSFTGTVLRTVNLQNNLVTDTPLPNNYAFLEFDQATGRLITARGNDIVAIDPANGAESVIAAVPVNLFGYVSAFDPIQRRLFFTGSVGSQSYLVTFNLQEITFSQVPSPSPAFLEYSFDISAIPVSPLWVIIGLAAVLGAIGMRRI